MIHNGLAETHWARLTETASGKIIETLQSWIRAQLWCAHLCRARACRAIRLDEPELSRRSMLSHLYTGRFSVVCSLPFRCLRGAL